MRVPKLRFKNAAGKDFPDWNFVPMKEICKINQGLQIPIARRFSESGPNRFFYITNEFLREGAKKKYFIENPSLSVICSDEDVLMTRTGNTGKVVTDVSGAFHNNFFKINYDRSLVNKGFLVEFLSKKETQATILKLAGTSTIPDLNHSDFYAIHAPLPALAEQQKIASFLSLADKKIYILTQKHELLIHYKKGVMQKIFNQEIRFKDGGGKGYPAWSQCKFEDIFSIANSKELQIQSSKYEASGLVPIVDQSNKKIAGWSRSEIAYKNIPVTLFGDHTRIVKWIDFEFRPGADGVQILKTRANIDPKFSYYILSKVKLPNLGYSRHLKELREVEFFIPSCINEQIQISNFISSIDEKIDLVANQLDLTQQYKQGLLQQMFI